MVRSPRLGEPKKYQLYRKNLQSKFKKKCPNCFWAKTWAPRHPRTSKVVSDDPQEPSWALNVAGWATLSPGGPLPKWQAAPPTSSGEASWAVPFRTDPTGLSFSAVLRT